MYTEQQIKDAGLDDFRVFLVQVWDFLGLPTPTRVQLAIAYWLQHGPRRLVLMAFRGVGKSWMTATFALWLLFTNPDAKVEIVSASGGLADDIAKFMKDLIRDMPLLEHLRPREGQRDKINNFDVGPAKVSKDPSVKAVGITGQITGTRADLIIADDIEVPKNSFTHHLREKLRTQVKEFDAILKPGGRVIYLGTPQVEESVYPFLGTKIDPNTKKPLYKIRVWTSEVPEKPEKYGEKLAPDIRAMIKRGAKPHDPVDPERFDEIDLAERKASYGLSGYGLQFMLDTELSSADRHPLKLGDLIILDVDPDLVHVKLVWGRDRDLVLEDLPAGGFAGDRYHRPAWKSDEMTKWGPTVMAIDPSGRGKDELAYAIVRYSHGMQYLVEVGGFLDGYSPETLSALAEAAARWNVNKVITERNYGGGMFDQLLRPYLVNLTKGSCRACLKKQIDCTHRAGMIDEEYNGWASGMKEERILKTLEPLVQQHRLVVNRKVIEEDVKIQQDNDRSKYSFAQQFTRMEKVKGALPHEDRVEAVAMACQYFVELMGYTPDQAVKKHKRKLLDGEIKDFLKHAIGGGRTKRRTYQNL